MKVFVVWEDLDDSFAHVIFSTKDKAQQWIDTIGNTSYKPYTHWEIEELEVQ